MKKRLLLKLGLAALLGVAGFAVYIWWTLPPHGINRTSVWRIRNGMSEKDVEAIIGMQYGDYRTMTKEERWFNRRTIIWSGVGYETRSASWYGDEGRITVLFTDGKVDGKRFGPRTPSFIDTLAEWLHIVDHDPY